VESKRRFIYFKLLTLALIIFTSARQAFAAEGGGGSQVGILYGLSVPDVANVNPHEFYGVKGSTYLVSTFSLGGYYFMSNHTQGHNGIDFDYQMSGIEGAYHIPNGGGDTYFGFRGGITKIAASPSGQDVLYSPWHYGVVVGYDYDVASWLALGFEGSFTHVEASSTTVSGTSYTQDKWSMINFLVNLSFRF
jgi:hypothetical protein